MEKYTEFNDLDTGINPYIRIIKYRYTICNFIFKLGIFHALLSLPIFMYKYFIGSFVTIRYETEKTKKRIERNRVFLCTYSSIFDVPVLCKIMKTPSVYIIRNREIFSVCKYNILKKIKNRSEIDKKIDKRETVVFLMAGGITNGEIYANPDEIAKIADIQQVISLKYTPNLSYDINLFDICVLPQFKMFIVSFIYHLVYFTTIPSLPMCTLAAADTLHELSEKTRIDISTSIDSKITEKFLKRFNLD